jgi:hypothetical protein
MTRHGTCAYCRRDGVVQFDHPTLRDERQRPYDPDFVVDACASCNKTRWHAFRLAAGRSFDVHPVARRQAAAAFYFQTSADGDRELLLTVPQQRAVARILREGAVLIVGLLGVVAALAYFLWGAQ